MKGKVLINLLIGYLSLTDLVCGGGDVWFWLIHQPPLDPNFSLHLYLVISSRPVGIAANNDAMIKHSPAGLSLRYFSLETFRKEHLKKRRTECEQFFGKKQQQNF